MIGNQLIVIPVPKQFSSSTVATSTWLADDPADLVTFICTVKVCVALLAPVNPLAWMARAALPLTPLFVAAPIAEPNVMPVAAPEMRDNLPLQRIAR